MTHRTCLFQSEKGVGRACLEDTFDKGEWQPFNAADCYGDDLASCGEPCARVELQSMWFMATAVGLRIGVGLDRRA